MRVYRYLSHSELEAIKNNEIEKLGSKYTNFKKGEINTHKYKEGEKYLHFFADKKDLYNIQMLYRKKSEDFYLCEFDIPRKTLLFHGGYGYYEPSGYDEDYKKAKEFALPVNKFKAEFLVGFSLDESKQQNQDRQM